MPPRRTRQNVELKVRLNSLPQARAIARRLATSELSPQHQIDTYFQCPQGRLKLREAEAGAELIWYSRPDRATSKTSDYLLVPVASPAQLKQALASAYGLRGVVDKRREIYLVHNVRIHLDRVRGLGHFLEFEAVLSGKITAPTGHKQVRELTQQFGIQEDQIVAASYIDLLARGD